jgi:hypothetical protein
MSVSLNSFAETSTSDDSKDLSDQNESGSTGYVSSALKWCSKNKVKFAVGTITTLAVVISGSYYALRPSDPMEIYKSNEEKRRTAKERRELLRNQNGQTRETMRLDHQQDLADQEARRLERANIASRRLAEHIRGKDTKVQIQYQAFENGEDYAYEVDPDFHLFE